MKAIAVEGLGKRYRLGERFGYQSLREVMSDRLSRRYSGPGEDFWALRDLTFDVECGEVVGLVGRNGAGKSTLLKIVSRITEPTEGRVGVRGRVGSLLEVGTGFHPELTGRENVWLNGALLGMSRQRITRNFDDIVEFAGVGKFLDTPLKRYSSGMHLRLAFSVAAHLEPDVVLVDEVLAVGDAEFQRKCIGKMSELHSHGRTVVFVSHDLGAIAQLCDRAIWIDHGGVREDGPTRAVLASYLHEVAPSATEVAFEPDGARVVQITSASVAAAGREPSATPRRDLPLAVRLRVLVREPILSLDLSVYVSQRGVRVLDEAWSDQRGAVATPVSPGSYDVEVTMPPLLAAGEYVLGAWIGTDADDFEDRELLSFGIGPSPDDSQAELDRRRVAVTDARWRLSRLSA